MDKLYDDMEPNAKYVLLITHTLTGGKVAGVDPVFTQPFLLCYVLGGDLYQNKLNLTLFVSQKRTSFSFWTKLFAKLRIKPILYAWSNGGQISENLVNPVVLEF